MSSDYEEGNVNDYIWAEIIINGFLLGFLYDSVVETLATYSIVLHFLSIPLMVIIVFLPVIFRNKLRGSFWEYIAIVGYMVMTLVLYYVFIIMRQQSSLLIDILYAFVAFISQFAWPSYLLLYTPKKDEVRPR